MSLNSRERRRRDRTPLSKTQRAKVFGVFLEKGIIQPAGQAAYVVLLPDGTELAAATRDEALEKALRVASLYRLVAEGKAEAEAPEEKAEGGAA